MNSSFVVNPESYAGEFGMISQILNVFYLYNK